MQHLGKAALRVTKNYTKGYSDTQAKVREATSNDPWGPSGTQMNEIAQLTYNQGDFVEIMEMLDKRLNDKGKNWRHVFKSLTLLDYCLHAGSENVVIYFRDNLYVIKTLKEFQFIDEEGKDQGANVRQKAKDITNLLQDEGRLREERRTRAHMRDRMIKGNGEDHGASFDEDENVARRRNNGRAPARAGPSGGEDDELKRAIEESKKSHAFEQAKAAEEKDLAEAIKLSEEEENKRHKAVEDSNANSLFDDNNQLAAPTISTNQFTANNTNPYANLQPQFTQLQPQFTAIQPQFTSFNPYQQQAQQEALQAEYLRQQQEFLFQQQQAQQQAQQQQQQQEEWLRQQQMIQFQQQQQAQQAQQQQQNSLFAPQVPLAPQPTGFGSNNPFAPATPSAFSQSGPSSPASSGPSFNLTGTYANSSAPSFTSSPSITPSASISQSSSPGPSRPTVKTNDAGHAQLANLFANRDDGMDTFGNTGLLRYGRTDAGLLAATKTGGHNPFAQQQQQQQQQGHDQPFFSI
ncbi:hypothetical protein ONZ45_g7120 [Pleurotus djamor]|nr:hypothetical protein ONZ45_g7120 [Pleurotus djamor]